MLAYRARTLAFSKMASSDGVVLLIFSTQRHLAKSAPSFLYCAQRSDSPSRPALQHTRSTPSERGRCLASYARLRTSYLGWLSLHLFQREGQHLCPPVETKQKWKIVFQSSKNIQGKEPPVSTSNPELMLQKGFGSLNLSKLKDLTLFYQLDHWLGFQPTWNTQLEGNVYTVHNGVCVKANNHQIRQEGLGTDQTS